MLGCVSPDVRDIAIYLIAFTSIPLLVRTPFTSKPQRLRISMPKDIARKIPDAYVISRLWHAE